MNLSSLFLLFLTVSVCGILVLNNGVFTSYDVGQPSPIKIEIEAVSGGDRYNDTVRFQDNILVLRHAGGKSVSLDSTSVQITGIGNSYKGIPGSGGEFLFGDLVVYYDHLNIDKKNPQFEKNNRETLKDGLWSPGEIIILTGNDSKNSSSSSVFVSVNGDTDTSENFGFSSHTAAEISVFQKSTKNKHLLFKKEIYFSKSRPA